MTGLRPITLRVMDEEIIVHPAAQRKVNGWQGEARIQGRVKIDDADYEFDQVVSLRLIPIDDSPLK